jgi:ankyrin repeat protein
MSEALTNAALMIAAGAGDLAEVRHLLAAGADANARDERGWPALAYAVYNAELKRGHAGVAQALIDAGADVLAKNEGGYTALAMAKQKFHVDVINMLHEAEQYAGMGAESCASRSAPDSSVITFMKRPQ